MLLPESAELSCGDQKTSTLLVGEEVLVLMSCVVSCSQVREGCKEARVAGRREDDTRAVLMEDSLSGKVLPR